MKSSHGAEDGAGALQPGDLAVHAVDHEAQVVQRGAGDQPASGLPGRSRRPPASPSGDGDRGQPVRRDPGADGARRTSRMAIGSTSSTVNQASRALEAARTWSSVIASSVLSLQFTWLCCLVTLPEGAMALGSGWRRLMSGIFRTVVRTPCEGKGRHEPRR